MTVPFDKKAPPQGRQAAAVTCDGNEAVARIAYAASETIAIYPITPSSPMAEWADEWASQGRRNIWGTVPAVVEMQSEGGVAGALHGALQGGSVATTFTASQGLLLMIPNLYKIAGELLPFCFHVTARTVATHALSIFGDHSDVMACRACGLTILCSGSVQEAHDMALVGHAATLQTRVPVLHFFDGFRTSHEVAKIHPIPDEAIAAVLDPEAVAAFRERALNPDRPSLRGTAQNPDTFFQAREACQPYYDATPALVQECMDHVASFTGRPMRLFEYVGHPAADRVVVMMGSGAEVAHEWVERAVARGERVGLVKVRLFRPFAATAFVGALPPTVRRIAVLDRTKEPGSAGEPLFQDVVTSVFLAGEGRFGRMPRIVGGRYGLSSKEFHPGMVGAVFEELKSDTPKNSFTVGIVDDVSGSSLPVADRFAEEPEGRTRAIFYALGSDGTVGANKNTVKIIGEETDLWVQGYFVYDSKKSGSMTVSHLRFGPEPIRSSYLIAEAEFVACHHFDYLWTFEILDRAAMGATLLLNAPYPASRIWDHLPRDLQETIVERRIRCFTIDAVRVARETGMGGRINTIMQTCFFALSGTLPREEAIARIKAAAEKSYAKKGPDVVEKNWAAIDQTLAALEPFEPRIDSWSDQRRRPIVPENAPDFVQRVTSRMLAGAGDTLPVSAFPVDGSWPTGTSRWEKRNLAQTVPVWDPALCIQCNKCVLVCPHATIRAKFYPDSALDGAPATFKHAPFRSQDHPGQRFTLQVAVEDCTGCGLCVAACPVKDKKTPRRKAINMEPQRPLQAAERENFEFFLTLPDPDRVTLKRDVKGSQFLRPLFEFSGACAGCGETPYLKLLSQLFGDRALIANATGCSSIYGGNLPTTPYAVDAAGRGPAWANSLFEDNAEFGLGLRLAWDRHRDHALYLLKGLAPRLGDTLTAELIAGTGRTEAAIAAQRERVAALRDRLGTLQGPEVRRLDGLADALIHRSVWIVGGDGWAYDIGYGGLDHVLSLGRDVNVLVLDTQVYSNTGGQCSKATPLAAVAKFAAAGKPIPQKSLALFAVTYPHVYVAQVALGASDHQTVAAFEEAESYEGPSLIVAFSPCIAHGYPLEQGLAQQKLAVETGFWPLFRHDPRRSDHAPSTFRLDSAKPKGGIHTFARNEARFRMLEMADPARARALAGAAQGAADRRIELLESLARDATASP